MRLGAGLTSAKLTLFFRSSTAGWTTESKHLFGAQFSLHGKKIAPHRLRGWSILNSFGNYCIGGSPSESHYEKSRFCASATSIGREHSSSSFATWLTRLLTG